MEPHRLCRLGISVQKGKQVLQKEEAEEEEEEEKEKSKRMRIVMDIRQSERR